MRSSTMRRGGFGLALLLALLAAVLAGQANRAGADHKDRVMGLAPLSEATQPHLDPTSEAELSDLETLAGQLGISLEAAIARYAWNDSFARAVSQIRDAFPDAFAGAEIVDAGRAWVAFSGNAPPGALDILGRFTASHSNVAVEVRTGIGYTEADLETAIPTVHYAVFTRPEVRDASTSFDVSTAEITTVVVLERGAAASILDDLRSGAIADLIDAGAAGTLDSISVSVVRSNLPRLGGDDSNTEQLMLTAGAATAGLAGLALWLIGRRRNQEGVRAMAQEERRRTWVTVVKLAVSLIAGFVVFMLLLPTHGVDTLPPTCWSVFDYEVPCDSRLALAAGVATAALVGLALWLIGHRKRPTR